MAEKDTLIIKGGKPLEGEVFVRGSKNAASKMMIASLLTDAQCRIENVPFSSEIDITKELCEHIGSTVDLVQSQHACVIQTSEVKNPSVTELTRKNRIPILAFGPLLHRRGFAEIPVLGGCPIGHRPINFHIEALTQMGVHIERREHSYYAETDHIHGADIELDYPSVGATENIILTAILADGKTTIRNAAVEPEIVNLISMLSAMGANIRCNELTREIEITGVANLKGVTARVIPDRNEIVSFATAALATRGTVTIRDIEPSYLTTFLQAASEVGAGIDVEPDRIIFRGGGGRPIAVQTSPHPGFMTDWQQPFCVLLTQAEGESIIHETVYEDRFGYVKELKRMGAEIEVSNECLGFNTCRFSGQTFNHSIRIKGSTPLKGTEITMPDIRAGMAHIIAALTAQGESYVSGVHHIDRGYEKIEERLSALGADIRRI